MQPEPSGASAGKAYFVVYGQFFTDPPEAEAFRQRAQVTSERLGLSAPALADAMQSITIISHAQQALNTVFVLASNDEVAATAASWREASTSGWQWLATFGQEDAALVQVAPAQGDDTLCWSFPAALAADPDPGHLPGDRLPVGRRLLAHLPLSLAEMAALAIHDTPRPVDG